MLQRVKHVLQNEEGSSNLEVLIWIMIIVVLVSFLLVFLQQVINFLTVGQHSVGIGQNEAYTWEVNTVRHQIANNT